MLKWYGNKVNKKEIEKFPVFLEFPVAHLKKPILFIYFFDLSKCVEKLFQYLQETLLGAHPNS